jgi:allophanate hydrolase
MFVLVRADFPPPAPRRRPHFNASAFTFFPSLRRSGGFSSRRFAAVRPAFCFNFRSRIVLVGAVSSDLSSLPLDLASLRAAFADGLTPTALVEEVWRREQAWADPALWIHRLPREHWTASAENARSRSATTALPLFGAPFAIKDNIDLGGAPTTSACPDFKYTAAASCPVVDRLIAAGAIPLGKTNLDQFATGLVGVRSPYGVPRNAFNSAYIPGGSSSGSATAVAAGLCSFSLGTDTAGSGRVPAAFNNLVGLKPTRGLLSTRGVVPACRTLDCVSIFTRTIADAADVLAVAAAYDPEDPYSRPAQPPAVDENWPPRVGVPRADQLQFFGNTEAAKLFANVVTRWQHLGATIVEIDFAPFLEAARLLYEGPWVAERYAAIRSFIEKQPDALHPVTRKITEGALGKTAVDTFEAVYKLAALRRRADAVWTDIDVLLTPTAGTIYKVAEVEADPIQLNSNLGYYTNYMNLLDLCAVAVPAGFLPSGLPWGVTLVAPAFHDDRVLRLGAKFLGEAAPRRALVPAGATTKIAVCGAHLSGLPLNGQLTSRGAKLLRATRTAPVYKLYALPGTTPPKPGLVRVSSGGVPIEVEVWEVPVASYGSFVAAIPAPLGIGTLTLEGGETVQGFLCEAAAVAEARDITALGSWRAFLKS